MQGLGSYKQGKMLFLGLGTGLGSCLVINGRVEPLELAHLNYRKGTYEDYVGRRGLEKRGRAKWSKDVAEVVAHLSKALQTDEIVLSGGNAKKLRELPKGCRLGSNANAFLAGFRLRDKAERSQFGKTNRTTVLERQKFGRNPGVSPSPRQKQEGSAAPSQGGTD